jgi:hypothetical protein
MARLTLARIVTAMPFVMLLAGCDREAPPAHVPPPPPPAPGPGPANRPADQPPPAAAPTGEQTTVARAYAGDVERFCAGVPPRQGTIKGCMKAHVAEPSAGCFDAVMSAIAAAQAP